MREIKFRAWDIKEKRYRTDGQLQMYEDGDWTYYVQGHCQCGYGCADEWLGKDRIELEWYTGLKDKNGTEIYEGDIVEYFQFSLPCSKCAHRDKFTNVVKFGALGVTLSSYRIIDPMSDISELEVVGNIHENPELLKG